MENPVAQGVGSTTPPASQPVTSHPSQSTPTSNDSNRKKKTGFFAVLAAVILLGAVGLTVFLGQQNTNNQQHASSSVVAGSCGPLATDTILVFDRSNSMKQPVNASAQTLFQEPRVPGDTTVSADDPDPDQESADEQTDVPAGDQVVDPTDTPTPTGSLTGTPTVTLVPTATTTPPVFPPTATPTPFGTTTVPSITGSVNYPTVPFPTGVLPVPVHDGATKLAKAQAAMRFYVDQVSKDSRNKVGLISFGPKARTDSAITSDYASVKTKINALKTSQGTCLSCGINIANKQMKKLTQDNNRARAIIIVSDGIANRVVRKGKSVKPGQNQKQAQDRSAQAAYNAAVNGYKKHGVPYYTIALGENANKDLMQKIANNTNGQYYFAPSEDDLQKIYADIVSNLGQGKISGQVFVDANNNGQKDPGERLLPGWTVVLKKKAAGSAQSVSVQTTRDTGVPRQGGSPTLSCSPSNITSFPQTITATLKDASGNPLNNKKIQFNITDKTDKVGFTNNPGKNSVVTTNKQGIATIKVNSKVSTVQASIAGKYDTATCTISVNGASTGPTVTGTTSGPTATPGGTTGSTSLSCSPAVLNQSGKLTATLTDANGKALNNKKVTFTSTNPKNASFGKNPGKNNVVTTNNKGVASVQINLNGQNVHETISGASVNGSACSVIADNTGATIIPSESVTEGPTGSTDITNSPTGGDNNPTDIPAGSLVAVTDANGNYTFTGVCSGDYEVSVQPQPGWTVTVPTDNKYDVTIDKGSSVKDKDFGVTGGDVTVTGPTGPSVTGGPSITGVTGTSGVSLGVTVFMHGIGKSGDNANPFPPECTQSASSSADSTGCLSNQSPLTPNRPFTVEVYGAQADTTQDSTTAQTPLDTGTGTLTYNASAGNFSGTVNLDQPLDPGPYVVKIRSTKYLKKSFGGIINIKPGLNTLPVISLVVGDAFTQDDSDNNLDIRDYNALLGCFSITAPPKDCQFIQNQKEMTDLDDDGQVNQNDYNLFIRELSVQYGD